MRTFSVFVHHAASTTPWLLFEIASDMEEVKALAARALADSDSRLAVEVLEGDKLVYSLDRNGESWPPPRQQGAKPSERPHL